MGAINAAFISLYPKGEEKEAVKNLEDMWLTHKAQDLWKEWPYMSIVEGMWKSSFLDNSPLYELIDSLTKNKTFHRKVAF